MQHRVPVSRLHHRSWSWLDLACLIRHPGLHWCCLKLSFFLVAFYFVFSKSVYLLDGPALFFLIRKTTELNAVFLISLQPQTVLLNEIFSVVVTTE